MQFLHVLVGYIRQEHASTRITESESAILAVSAHRRALPNTDHISCSRDAVDERVAATVHSKGCPIKCVSCQTGGNQHTEHGSSSWLSRELIGSRRNLPRTSFSDAVFFIREAYSFSSTFLFATVSLRARHVASRTLCGHVETLGPEHQSSASRVQPSNFLVVPRICKCFPTARTQSFQR